RDAARIRRLYRQRDSQMVQGGAGLGRKNRMKRRREMTKAVKLFAGAAISLACMQSASAAEIKVLSAGAVEPGLKAAASAFQKSSGHEVKITFNTAPQIRKRVGDGEVQDVVIAPPALIDE